MISMERTCRLKDLRLLTEAHMYRDRKGSFVHQEHVVSFGTSIYVDLNNGNGRVRDTSCICMISITKKHLGTERPSQIM